MTTWKDYGITVIGVKLFKAYHAMKRKGCARIVPGHGASSLRHGTFRRAPVRILSRSQPALSRPTRSTLPVTALPLLVSLRAAASDGRSEARSKHYTVSSDSRLSNMENLHDRTIVTTRELDGRARNAVVRQDIANNPLCINHHHWQCD